MSYAFRTIVMIAATAGALSGMAGERLYAQGVDPNAAPNPYKMQEDWAHLPEGRKFGVAIKVQVDHSDGKSIWVFDRCGARECTNSTLAPMQKFDSSGKFQKAIGANIFAVPHGFYVDREGNAWGGDQIARNGKGADLIKFAPDGKVLMTLGKPGMPGNGPGYLTTGSAVVVAPNGDIYVGDGHGDGTNDRIVKFAKDGTFITGGASTARGRANSTRRTASRSTRWGASMSPIAPTTAFRFSSRTASSLPNGSSSAGRATLPSTRTTCFTSPIRNRPRATILGSRKASASGASRTARSPPSFRSRRLRPARRKASAWTTRATSMLAGPPRWPCGAT